MPPQSKPRILTLGLNPCVQKVSERCRPSSILQRGKGRSPESPFAISCNVCWAGSSHIQVLRFEGPLVVGDVNRAVSVSIGVGGKGQNFACVRLLYIYLQMSVGRSRGVC